MISEIVYTAVKMSAMDEVETKLKEVEINSDLKENRADGDITAEKADKKKKKGKKKSKVGSAKNPEEQEEKSEATVPQEIEKNQPENEENEGPVCAFCKKTGPTKRCSKRHQKCLAKMFCNETCESLAHEDKKAALVKKEANKAVAAKKKASQKVKNWKNTDSGQFWWHDQ